MYFQLMKQQVNIILEDENKENKRKIRDLSDSVSNKKKKEMLNKDIKINLNKIEEINILKKEKGNIIPLSCAMFILYGDEIVYLFSGSYKEYMKFYGQYRIQWEIIKYACDNQYKRYNFYGIFDVFNKEGKDRGVYEFKKGFKTRFDHYSPIDEVAIEVTKKNLSQLIKTHREK